MLKRFVALVVVVFSLSLSAAEPERILPPDCANQLLQQPINRRAFLKAFALLAVGGVVGYTWRAYEESDSANPVQNLQVRPNEDALPPPYDGAEWIKLTASLRFLDGRENMVPVQIDFDRSVIRVVNRANSDEPRHFQLFREGDKFLAAESFWVRAEGRPGLAFLRPSFQANHITQLGTIQNGYVHFQEPFSAVVMRQSTVGLRARNGWVAKLWEKITGQQPMRTEPMTHFELRIDGL